jgi:DNA-binding NarL/FixJ family response regulator
MARCNVHAAVELLACEMASCRPGRGLLPGVTQRDQDRMTRLQLIQQRGRGRDTTLPGARLRMVIADDHELTRAGLRTVLAQEPGLELVGEACNGREAVELARLLQPDLVLMDVRMPDIDGLQATQMVKQVSPMTTVLILSMFEDAEVLLEAVRAGAAGYVLKDLSEDALRNAVWEALAGGLPVDQYLAREVLLRLASEQPPAGPGVPRPDPLSAREREVLGLLARGYTNREIGEQLVITQHTVKVHVEHILAKLEVSDRTQAAVKAIELGYITTESGAAHRSHPKSSS